MHSEQSGLHRSSRTGFFRTRVDVRGGDGVGCEDSAAGFLVDVTGRSGITDARLEPSEDADSGTGTGGTGTGVETVGTCTGGTGTGVEAVGTGTDGTGTGVEAVGTGDSCSSGVGPRECAGLRASADGHVGLSGTRVGWATVTSVLSSSSGAGMRWSTCTCKVLLATCTM